MILILKSDIQFIHPLEPQARIFIQTRSYCCGRGIILSRNISRRCICACRCRLTLCGCCVSVPVRGGSPPAPPNTHPYTRTPMDPLRPSDVCALHFYVADARLIFGLRLTKANNRTADYGHTDNGQRTADNNTNRANTARTWQLIHPQKQKKNHPLGKPLTHLDNVALIMTGCCECQVTEERQFIPLWRWHFYGIGASNIAIISPIADCRQSEKVECELSIR